MIRLTHMSRSKPGSFTPYLEYMQREKRAEPSSAPSSPLTLCEILNRQVQRALPMPDLQTLSGMDPSRFQSALKTLRDSEYLTIQGSALDAIVTLTDKGAEVIRLARPA